MSARHRRTLLLAVSITAVVVWAAIYRFDVPPQEVGRLFLYCLGIVCAVIVLAAAFVLVVKALQKLWARLS